MLKRVVLFLPFILLFSASLVSARSDTLSRSLTELSSWYINQTAPTLEPLFQGSIPGVHTTLTSGLPGSGAIIRIRGLSTLWASNQPLYIINGIPVISGRTGRSTGQTTHALSDLNPADIASVKIVKDAFSSATYGVRGASGIVKITTNAESENKRPRFNTHYYRGITSATTQYELLSGPEWSKIYREALDNFSEVQYGRLIPNLETWFGYPAIPASNEAPDHNYLQEVMRKGVIQQAALSVNGGNSDTRYYFSGTWHETEGYIIENRFQRMSARAGISHNATQRILFGAHTGITRTLNNRVPSDNMVAGALTSAVLMPPINPIYDEYGRFNFHNPWNYADNPVGAATLNSYTTNHWRLSGSFFGNYSFLNDFYISAAGGLDLLLVDDYHRYSEVSGDGAPNGIASQNISETALGNISLSINYRKSFERGHHIKATAGSEQLRSRRLQVTVAGSGFVSDLLPNVSSAAYPLSSVSYVDVDHGLTSWFFRGKYTFKNRYIINASLRADASSRFGKNKPYGFFPGGSLKWQISEEPFFGNRLFDFLHFYVGYGVSGNSEFGDFLSAGSYRSTRYANKHAFYPGIAPNQDLTHERTHHYDTGFYAQLFQNKISLFGNIYQKRIRNLILMAPTPLTSGFERIVENAGSMDSRGFEAGVIKNNTFRKFQWTIQFHLSYQENIVTQTASGQNIDHNLFMIQEGKPLASFYLIRWHGVDPETGTPQWLDANGDITTTPNADDRVFNGHADPPWFGGVKNAFSYKGVSLDFLFEFAAGHKVYNVTYWFMMNNSLFYNLHTDYLKRWQEPGDVTNIPRNIYGDPDRAAMRSTRFLEDASFIRLRHLSLSCRLPDALTRHFHVNKTRIFVQAQNAWTWSRLRTGDPEGSFFGQTGNLYRGENFFTPPQQRTIIGGIIVEF